jgi:hypothetical protein
LIELQVEREALVDAFIAVYPSKIEAIREKLRDLYNAKDYPDVETVREKFTMSWNFLEYDVPGRLRRISVAAYEAEVAKVKADVESSKGAIQDALRASMLGLVDHAVDRLTPGADGKKKIFKASFVEKMQNFLKTFDARNITGDEELAAIVEQAKGIMNGVDAKALRKEDALRDAIAGQFERIRTAMAGMVVNKPKRLISFDDGDGGAENEGDGEDAAFSEPEEDGGEFEAAEAVQ